MPSDPIEPLNESPGIPRYAMLDLWMALGGDSEVFEAWMADPKRTPADAWAQLLAAVRGDTMPGDTNPYPGAILQLVWNRTVGDAE